MKKIALLALIIGLSNAALAEGTIGFNPNVGTSTVVPLGLQTILNNDKSISFTDWKSPISCIYNDQGRIYRYVASIPKGSTVPTVTVMDSGTAVQGSQSYVTMTPRTDINTRSPLYQKGISNMTFSGNYTPVSTVPINGNYTFITQSTKGARSTIITPSGFYYSLNGAQYMKGC